MDAEQGRLESDSTFMKATRQWDQVVQTQEYKEEQKEMDKAKQT